MKKGWLTKTLGEVLEKTETVNPLQSPNTEFDYIDVSSVSNTTFEIEETQRLKGKDAPSRARKLVRTNDIIFATIRPTLQRIAVVPEHLDKQVCSTGYFVLRPKQGIDYRFVFYSLFTENFIGQMESLQKGASYPAVTDGDVRAQEIPVPPLAEQQRIVGLLDEAFEGLATAKANAEKNLQNARALFESHLQSVFTQRGPGWEQKRMVELCSIITCGVASTPKYVDETVGVPFLSAQNVKDGEVLLKKYRFISRGFHEKLTKKNKPQVGDILYSRVGAKFGEAAVVEHDFEFSVYVSLTLIRPIATKLDNYFLKLYLNSPSIKLLAKKSISSSGVPNLNVKDVREFPISFPSIEKQRRIVSEITTLQEETQRLARIYERKLAALAELKKSLLHQAFTGEL